MKIALGIIIGIMVSVSSVAVAQEVIKMIRVPEYVGGYKTVDLLQYVANQKDKEIKEQETAKKQLQNLNKKLLPSSA
jgi:hypothetical protein